EALVRIPQRFPGAAVPQDDRAGAVLALRDGAFEAAIVQRMILDMHGQPLFAGNEAGPARDRPAFQDAVHLQAEIVMQPGGVVLLDDETGTARVGSASPGLRRDREVPLLAVGFQRHGRYPARRKAALGFAALCAGRALALVARRGVRPAS